MVEAGNADDKGPFDQPNPMGCNGCDDSRAPLNKHGYCQPCAKKQGPTLKNAEEPVTVIPATPPAPGHKIPPPPAGLKVAPKPAGGLPYPNGEKDNAVTACACTHPATAHEGGEGPCRECSCQAYREGDEAENAAGDTPPHMRIDSREWAKQHDTKTGHDVIIPEKSEPWCKDCGATWNYSEQKEVQNAAHPAMEAFEAHLKACNACSSEYANAAPDPAKLCEDGQRLLTAGANENSERRNALPAPLIAPTYTDLADAGAAFWGRTP